jgi:hypothetical protein
MSSDSFSSFFIITSKAVTAGHDPKRSTAFGQDGGKDQGAGL